MSRLQLSRYQDQIESTSPFPTFGHVTRVSGLIVEGTCRDAVIGAVCEISSLDKSTTCLAEVVGFRDDKVLFMPLGEARGLGLGSSIAFKQKSATIRIGPQLLGRAVDGLLNPIDGGPAIECEEEFSIYSSPLNPLKRVPISEPLDVGIRAVNALLTAGKGQRIGILSGSGVGKSMLLGQMARYTTADVNVIALIGERGREVREFIERDLGPEGMARSVVICATSDVAPVVRMRAAFAATTIAEYFRRQGHNVLLTMDSITRFAMAQREVGLSAGEPPTTKGYTPSVFTLLPRICERAGNSSSGGSITAFYTVLVEADDINDPIGDAIRSIVDGHIVLSRDLAAQNHFPAIDVNQSASRVMAAVASEDHQKLAARIKTILAKYRDAEDLINIGAYVRGSDKAIDEAIQYIDAVKKFLRQHHQERSSFQDSLRMMNEIFANETKKGAGR